MRIWKNIKAKKKKKGSFFNIKPLQNSPKIRKAKKFLNEKIAPNIWRLLTATVIVFTLFIICRTCLTMIRTYAEIHRLNNMKERYLQSIAEDSTLIERLKYDEYLEQYARENFHMQRRNEQVYIIDK